MKTSTSDAAARQDRQPICCSSLDSEKLFSELTQDITDLIVFSGKLKNPFFELMDVTI